MQCNCDYILPTQEGWEMHYDNCATKWKIANPDKEYPRNSDGKLSIVNKHLRNLDVDILYHLGLDTKNNDLVSMFGDVKFICMGGTKYRMREFAKYLAKMLNIDLKGENLPNLTKHAHRFAMYKIGPVISVSHGMGIPSMSILLQELIKLISYARMEDPIIFRLGSCGGLDVPPGTVVVSTFGMNGTLEKTYDLPILGTVRRLPAIFDKRLGQELQSLSDENDDFLTVLGGTMAADDFYRGQARLDGPFCDYSDEEKMSFVKKVIDLGVKNIEMEATAFAAMATEAALRAADLCVTFVRRLDGDQVTPSKEQLNEWQERPMIIAARYIKKYCETYNKT